MLKSIRILTLVALLVPSVFAADAEGQRSKRGRVRANEPTVVTVTGRADTVQERDASEPRSLPSKVGRGIVGGVAATGRAFTRLGGWLLNTQDDIPSERQRRTSAKEDSAR